MSSFGDRRWTAWQRVCVSPTEIGDDDTITRVSSGITGLTRRETDIIDEVWVRKLPFAL